MSWVLGHHHEENANAGPPSDRRNVAEKKQPSYGQDDEDGFGNFAAKVLSSRRPSTLASKHEAQEREEGFLDSWMGDGGGGATQESPLSSWTGGAASRTQQQPQGARAALSPPGLDQQTFTSLPLRERANLAPIAIRQTSGDSSDSQQKARARERARRMSTTSVSGNELISQTGFCGKLYERPSFGHGSLLLILVNAVWIGIDTDLADDPTKLHPDTLFWGNQLFCVLFTAEILVRFFAYRKCKDFFKDPVMYKWNLFDGILVALMIFEDWVLAFIFSGSSSGAAALPPEMGILRLLRLLRLSRVFRMVPELGMMVQSMVAAARSVSSTMVLLVMLMYVYAIILTQWLKGSEERREKVIDEIDLNEHFGSILKCMLTLTQVLVFDDTFSLIRAQLKETWAIGLMMLLFILVGAFTVLNMLIGVICEIVSETKAQEQEKRLRQKARAVFESIDADGNGTLSPEEISNPATFQKLEKLGIDAEVLTAVFQFFDTDDSGDISYTEFIEMIFKLIHPPETQDVLSIQRGVSRVEGRLLELIDAQQEAANNMDKDSSCVFDVDGGGGSSVRPGGSRKSTSRRSTPKSSPRLSEAGVVPDEESDGMPLARPPMKQDEDMPGFGGFGGVGGGGLREGAAAAADTAANVQQRMEGIEKRMGGIEERMLTLGSDIAASVTEQIQAMLQREMGEGREARWEKQVEKPKSKEMMRPRPSQQISAATEALRARRLQTSPTSSPIGTEKGLQTPPPSSKLGQRSTSESQPDTATAAPPPRQQSVLRKGRSSMWAGDGLTAKPSPYGSSYGSYGTRPTTRPPRRTRMMRRWVLDQAKSRRILCVEATTKKVCEFVRVSQGAVVLLSFLGD